MVGHQMMQSMGLFIVKSFQLWCLRYGFFGWVMFMICCTLWENFLLIVVAQPVLLYGTPLWRLKLQSD